MGDLRKPAETTPQGDLSKLCADPPTRPTQEEKTQTRAGNTVPDASPNPILGYPAFKQAARMMI